MGTFFQQIISILTTQPSNIAYHLILTITVFGVFQIVYNQWRDNRSSQTRRLLTGFGLLVFIRTALFIIAGLVWLGLTDPFLILPPVERVINLLSLLIIIWMWIFPEPFRLADTLSALAGLLITIIGGFTTYFYFIQSEPSTFNNSVFDTGWEIATLSIGLVGVLLLLFRRPKNWGIGLSMLITILTGDLVHLLNPDLTSHFPGPVRLTQIIAYPLLFSLSQRYPVSPQPAPQTLSSINIVEEKTRPYQKRATEVNLLQSLIYLSISEEPKEVYNILTKSIALSMVSDYCLLVTTSNDNQMVIQCGYDLIKEQYIEGTSIDSESIPALSSTIQRSRPLLLPSDSTSIDQQNLAESMNLRHTGNLLAIPLKLSDSSTQAAVVLLSPFSNHSWTIDDQSDLEDIAPAIAKLLENIQRQTEIAVIDQSPAREFEGDRQQIERLERENEELVATIASLKTMQVITDEDFVVDERLVEDFKKTKEQLDALTVVYENTTEELETLISENQELIDTITEYQQDGEPEFQSDKEPSDTEIELQETKERYDKLSTTHEETLLTLDGLSEEKNDLLQKIQSTEETSDDKDVVEHIEGELHLALEEITTLQGIISKSNKRISELQALAIEEKTPDTEQIKVIASIAQELRQPMSSIAGYTDLLLGESVGILGALQRKFLDRVKSSAERMNSLIDDMIHLVSLDSGLVVFSHELVDINNIIDDTISLTSNQLREKKIILRVDIQEDLPKLNVDKDALQQILINLLENAGSTTPVEGEITLRAKLESNGEDDDYYILLQITDTGGGIPPEDLSRVFSRLYRADNPLIEGVGDTGVGLSIAKTLTEALGGRIWVESKEGAGSTFSVLLSPSAKAFI
jgi:signal transduction histidine kinase